MDTVHRIKMWIGGLTEIGLMLLALVAQLGSNGLVGLIVLGIIMWLFSHRSVA